MNIEPNYKNKRKYNTAKYPIRQPIYLTWLIWVLSKFALMGKKYKIDRINMDGLTAPYIILSNHMCFMDFELLALGTYPERMNNVVNIDGYFRRPWLMEWIGAIATRKFTMDLHLIKSIRKVLSRGDVLCMYPEARYSPAGTTSFLPESLGMLVKRCGVPVVTVVHRGNYLAAPFWNFRDKRRVRLHTTIEKTLTPEDIEKMSVQEINDKLREALDYDEYRYQKDEGIIIDKPTRAEGLHRILYKCPHCKSESAMGSKGEKIFCGDCGREWELTELGEIRALDGESEFVRVPDWFEWQRAEVKAEIDRGEYRYEDEIDVFSLPRCWKFEKLGRAKIVHDIDEGFIIEGEYRGEKYRIQRLPLEINSLHVEYDYFRIRRDDCFDISTENDSFYCYPTRKNIVTKLAFATEEIYKRKLEQRRGQR